VQPLHYIKEREVEAMKEQATVIIDVTGVPLSPGNPKDCEGNGEHPGKECCCDECDFFMECYPEWDTPLPKEQGIEPRSEGQ
jgi:hypothetical protein